MRRLIENQIIRIDNHRAGGIIDWNDQTTCIHIHKECFRNNKKYIIKVPLNRDERRVLQMCIIHTNLFRTKSLRKYKKH